MTAELVHHPGRPCGSLVAGGDAAHWQAVTCELCQRLTARLVVRVGLAKLRQAAP